MKILIVGGGVAGLATGAFVRQRVRGAKITILEKQASVLDERPEQANYGIAVAPNGCHCLALLGIKDVLTELHACELTQIHLRTANDETIDESVFPARASFGAPSVFCRRQHLLAWLLKQCNADLPDAPAAAQVEIRTGCRITSIDVHKGSATLEDGTTFEADVLVCADGIAKVGRTAFEEATRQPGTKERVTQCLYMANIDAKAIRERPLLAFLQNNDTLANWWCGEYGDDSWSADERQRAYQEQRGIIMYPIDKHGTHQLFATLPASPSILQQFGRSEATVDTSAKNDGHDSGSLPGPYHAHKSVLRQIDARVAYDTFPTFDEHVRSLLLTNPTVDLGLMRDSDPLHAWSIGKAVLVGDAAHASIPNTGQGSAQSLEDAECLSFFLAKAANDDCSSGPFSVQDAFAAYERIRIPRAHLVQHAGRMAVGMEPGMQNFDQTAYNMATYPWTGTHEALAAVKEKEAEGCSDPSSS